ncbi:MAG: FAD:protein FMN transferase [Actinobacteria bacterium]|nr:FAD:protein FMN transferase [Actinomycetota bacterium]
MDDYYRVNALGTTCVLAGFSEFPSDRAISIFSKYLIDFDETASRFRSDSELMTIFNGSRRSDIKVSPLLFDAITAAMFGAGMSNGYVDPTVARSLVALGYDRDFRLISQKGSREASIRVVLPKGYSRVRLNSEQKTISVAEGVTFDLGATGKAFLADRIKTAIEAELEEAVLVNLGGDISASTLDNGKYWTINITDDCSLDPWASGLSIGICGGGITTSSTTTRKWTAGGREIHHIIDPFNGTPAETEFYAVTALAGSALDANIATTGTLAMGKSGREWLARLRLPAMARGARGDFYFGGWLANIGKRRSG